MDAPDRSDEPAASWEYRDRQCHVYAAEDPVDGETVWAGYARTRLPASEGEDELALDVPGEVLAAADEGWVGFSVSGADRDVDGTRAEVEGLVDQLIELEASMDG